MLISPFSNVLLRNVLCLFFILWNDLLTLIIFFLKCLEQFTIYIIYHKFLGKKDLNVFNYFTLLATLLCHPKYNNAIVINPFPGNFINQGEDRLLSQEGEKKLAPPPDKANHKPSYLLSILLRVHSSFPQIIYCPLRGLHPSSPFLKIFKTEF